MNVHQDGGARIEGGLTAEIVEAGERIVNVWWDFHYGRFSIFDDLDAPFLPIKRDIKIIVPLAFPSLVTNCNVGRCSTGVAVVTSIVADRTGIPNHEIT